MLRGKIKFVLAGTVLAGAAVAVASCASVLGIDDLQPAEDGGASTPAATSGSAGASGSGVGGAQGVTTVGSSGASGVGGAAGVSGGAAGALGGAGGSAPDASGMDGALDGRAGSAGSSGAGGAGGQDAGKPDGAVEASDGGGAITVQGSVIGYWRHRVANVDVFLGNRATKTDINGRFTFANVTPPYDIGLAVRGARNAAWLFRGLTRSDPTLQVKDAFDPSSAPTNYHFQNYPAQSSSDGGLVPFRHLVVGFGSADTAFEFDIYQPTGADYTYNYGSWESALTTSGTAHALLWETPEDSTVSPTRYVAYDAKPMAIQANTSVTVSLDMTADNTPAGQVTGTISSFAADRKLDGYVRFSTGAIIHVVSVENSPTSFSMLMPNIPNSSITVSALSGTTSTGPYALAHRDAITPGDAGIQLTVPQPVSLSAPIAGTTGVAADATFQWSASPSVALVAADCDGATTDDPHTFYYVVTEDYRAQLPSQTAPAGFPLPKNRHCYWWVEIHGTYATLDDATGPTGLLDPFTYLYDGELVGPKRDDGSFSVTAEWGFTTAP